MCLCAYVSVRDISPVVSYSYTPVHEFPKAQLRGRSDSTCYSSAVPFSSFIVQGLYFGLMPVTLKCESYVLAKIKVIFKEAFA